MATRNLLVVSPTALKPDLVSVLNRHDWDVHLASDAKAAWVALACEPFEAALAVLWPEASKAETDALMALAEDSQWVRWVLAADRERILQPDCCLALAAELLFSYIPLPLDPLQAAVILDHAHEMAGLEKLFLANQQTAVSGRFGMVGDSPPMRDLYRKIEKASTCDASVVILGESGTGKELTARAIHEGSARGAGPFVAVNCAAIPVTLIQAELFGYEKGAFTDATTARPGYIESANGGTLFLDEVADLPPEAQVSLLRTLESREIVRLGSTTTRGVDIRIIAATQRDLLFLVKQDRFRLDLYYRLQVLGLRVPSLREREQDIALLAQHFLNEFALRNRTRAQGFSRAALVRIQQHDWPGNLRELRNRVHQAALECTGRWIAPALLRLERRSGRRNAATLRSARESAEVQAIRAALARTGQNTLQAAEELEVSRMTLYRLMQKHGIEPNG